jgi:alpha-tubulin suppressor-like RCC1 family protein
VGWGDNHLGQLGDGDRISLRTPRILPGPVDGVVQVAGGGAHGVELRSDGTVWTWGVNSSGQLGDRTRTNRLLPVRVPGLTQVVQVAAGDRDTLAVRSDGTVWAWGDNAGGQLGDGTRTRRLAPVRVRGLTNVVRVDAGLAHGVALRGDGTVWAWGANRAGQLGDRSRTDRLTPVRVGTPSGITQIDAGWRHTVALRRDGTAWAWGSDERGQLGDGRTTAATTPVRVAGLSGVSQVAAGGVHTLAVVAGARGGVFAWGWNNNGQLGDGTRSDRHRPVRVRGLPAPAGATPAARLVAAGSYHSMAVASDSQLWTWGDNGAGQLGDGTLTDRGSARPVPGLTAFVQIAAGNGCTLVVSRV